MVLFLVKNRIFCHFGSHCNWAKNLNNPMKGFFKENKILVIILLGSFLASLIYSFYFRITPVVDARAYDVIAMNIVDGNGFREDLGTDINHDGAIVRVGPLYEYFLAGTYKIFGHHYEFIWIFQALAHALSALFIYLAVLLIFQDLSDRRKIALWAAAIFGFYPDLIEISAMLLTETLYLFLATLMFYLFFLYFRRPNNHLLVWLGLISGLATLARSPILFLVPIILFLFYKKRLWMKGVLFLAILALVFVPWTARNYLVYQKIMPFGAGGSFNFWIGNYQGSNGEQEPQKIHFDYMQSHNVNELQDESIRQFKNYIIHYPAEFVKLSLLRANKYFSVSRPMGFWFYQQGIGKLLMVFSSALASIFLFIFGLAGMIRAFKEKKPVLNYLLAFAIVTPLIIFITVVETRYRFQIYPLLAIFAGYFLVFLSSAKKWWADKILWLAILIVSLNGLLDLILSFSKFKERLGGFF